MTTREAHADAATESDKAFALAAYVLHLAGSVVGVPSIAGLVVNYVKRGGAEPRLATHHNWMIRTFWWALAFVVVGWLTKLFLIGWVVIGLTWVWYVYRHVLGLIRLANGEAMVGAMGHSMA